MESFHTEQEALAVIRRALNDGGPAAVASWSLGRSDHRGQALSGQALLDRAHGVVPA